MGDKTFKREVALVLVVGLGFTVWRGDVAMVEAIVWPFLSFAALAFGMDWYGKVGSNTRGSGDGLQRNPQPNTSGGERTDR